MEMPVVPQQMEFPSILRANVRLWKLPRRRTAAIARRKDIFARCRKAIVWMGAQDVVSRDPKCAQWTILQCVVVTELLMEMPVVPQDWEFPSSSRANVRLWNLSRRQIAAIARRKDFFAHCRKAIVRMGAQDVVFRDPKYARWTILQCVVVTE
jgi:hypothetical protein